MPSLTQGPEGEQSLPGVNKTNWKFIGKFIAFAVLSVIALLSLTYHSYPILTPFAGILAFSFLIAFFLDIFRRIRKKPEVPIRKEIPMIVRVFLFLVCLSFLGLFWAIADISRGQSEPYGAILGMVLLFILFWFVLAWWLVEFISLIIKLIRKQKTSKFQIIFVLILPLIFSFFFLLNNYLNSQ